MKKLIIFVGIIVITALLLFTGTWVFDFLAMCGNLFTKSMHCLSDIFNFFGWNNGIIRGVKNA